MLGVFISYRRDDSVAVAGRLYDHLAAHFGTEQVFRDFDAIAPGAKFENVIEERISQSSVLIAVIGNEWLNAKTTEGLRRLDDPKDFVKTEIREALNQRKLVIPALIEGASVPKADELPDDIVALASKNALEISESRFKFGADRVIDAVEKAGVSPKSGSEVPSLLRQHWWARIRNEENQRTWKFVGGAIGVIVAGVWTAFVYFNDSPVGRPQGEIAAGGNVTAASGGIVNTGSNNTFIMGITPEQHGASLRRREKEVRAEERAEFAQANVRIRPR